MVGEHVFFLEADGDLASIYRIDVSGGQQERIVAGVNGALGLSPDAAWIIAAVPTGHGSPSVVATAYSLEGAAPPLPVCESLCNARWSSTGEHLYLSFLGAGDAEIQKTFVVTLRAGRMFPDLPASGFSSEEQVESVPGAFTVEPGNVVPGPTSSQYAFTRTVVNRNLYEIPLP